jgi:nitrogen fixation/metabolism regulation signal transduction histidine kinase
MRYGNRYQFGLTLLSGFFLLATAIAIFFYAVMPETPATRSPLLLTAFVAILFGTLVCLLIILRWVSRPYRKLVGEAEKVPVTSTTPRSRDEGEFVLETFQSVVAELQEQRHALEQLSNQASKRADSAERFSERIVASVPSALIAFDGAGCSMVINAPGRALLGLDGSALGQPVDTVLQHIPQLAQMVASCLRNGTVFSRQEIETVNSEQVPRKLGAAVAPIELGSDHGSRGVLCLLTDITEVAQLREQVALKKNLESLGEMSAGLAHEFKNAIATLQGYVQLLQTLQLDDQARGTAASLLNEVRNLSDLITSFLNFARPQPLQLDEVDLNEVIADCASELAPFFEEHKVALVIEPGFTSAANERDDRKLEIRADERMLRQALLNLMRNAAEAIPDSQNDRRVNVLCSTARDKSGKTWAAVEIKDTGEGIPVADLQRIFIPFFTTKTAGHGVGLALAHRVITQHGGTLTASNATDGGAVFSIRLPL